MPMYLVRWEINIEADTPREAAEQARNIHADPESIATVFDVGVVGTYPIREWTTIDLSPEQDTQ